MRPIGVPGLVLLILAWPGLVRAEMPPRRAPATPAAMSTPISATAAAQLLIEAGRFAEAKQVLLAIAPARPDDNEIQFLLGIIALQAKDYDDAVHRFRDILAREPDAARVRLELARTFYLNRDFDNAERQFRFARAGDLPDAAKTNIDRYLAEIRRARTWSHDISVAAVPDTNINAGPAVPTVGLYGLPFELSQNARRQSGIGLKIDLGGEWSPRLTDNARWRFGGRYDGTIYPSNGAFNDMTLAAYGGLRLFAGRWEISPLITGFHRWYGNSFYNQGLGGSVQTIWYPLAGLGLVSVVGAQLVDYAPPAGQNGPALSGAWGLVYTISPSTTVSAWFSASRQDAARSVFAYTASKVQIGFDRDLPAGWSLSTELSYVTVDYDQGQAAFGVARRDRQWTGRIAALNRRIDIQGFAPRITYIYTRNASNISLYTYVRNQIEVGLTRFF